MSQQQKRFNKISRATDNMATLIDCLIKDGLKNYQKTGETELDIKFLKESVTVLRELWNLVEESEEPVNIDQGIVIRLEGQVEQFSK